MWLSHLSLNPFEIAMLSSITWTSLWTPSGLSRILGACTNVPEWMSQRPWLVYTPFLSPSLLFVVGTQYTHISDPEGRSHLRHSGNLPCFTQSTCKNDGHKGKYSTLPTSAFERLQLLTMNINDLTPNESLTLVSNLWEPTFMNQSKRKRWQSTRMWTV